MSQNLQVRNPATSEVVGSVQVALPTEVVEAVDRARRAQQTWNRLTVEKRAFVIRRFHDLMLERHENVLDTIQAETGKTRRDALAEVVTVSGTARYYLTHAAEHLQATRRLPAVPAFTSAEVLYKPHGAIGLITPWNYPFLLPIADALPALLAGNAVIIKPSELTPLSAALGRDLLVESGLDPNLLVLVQGPGEIGAELVRHVDYVGFTGGTVTGRKVAMAASARLIPYSLELGGKNPMIVLEGASLEAAATGLVAGAFANSGQTCIAVERVYVAEPMFKEFTQRVVEKTKALKLGWSKSWDLDVGCLISTEHAQKVIAHIQRAEGAGARIECGGVMRSELGSSFVQPTVLTGVTDDMAISHEETFGPVVAIYPVRSAEEAVQNANRSQFGLNASVWGRNQTESRDIARRLETGTAGINSTLLIYNTFDVPMGGVKLSGIGRRHGEQGILRYTQAQSIVSSVEMGGGYDSMLFRIKSERMANALLSALRWWRRLA